MKMRSAWLPCVLMLMLFACGGGGLVSSAHLQVVAMVEAGELGTGAEFEVVRLPDHLASASASGEVIVLRETRSYAVVFFIQRGFVDTWEGVVFESDGAVDGDPLAGGDPVAVEPLGDGWFYVRTGR